MKTSDFNDKGNTLPT